MSKEDYKEDYKFKLLNLGVQIKNPISVGFIQYNESRLKKIPYKVNNPYWLKARIGYVLITLLVIICVFGPAISGISLMIWIKSFTRLSELSVLMMGIVAAQATYLFTMISWDMYERLPPTKKVLIKYKYEDE